MTNHLPTKTQNAFNVLWLTQFSLMLKRCCLVWLSLFSIIFSNAQTVETFSTTGAGTWIAPCGVTSITVEVWGAGGGGQGVTGNGKAARGGGGSGGGFVKTTYLVTPGNSYNFSVGNGGNGENSANNNGQASWFIDPSTILAVGGLGSTTYAINSSGGGMAALKTGNKGGAGTYGGDGANADNNNTGGGGSSAGNANGNNATGINGGVAVTNGFSGADGIGGEWGNGNNGGIGAGGSGSKKGTGNTTWIGGKGGNGQIIITYSSPIQNYCVPTFTTGVQPITNVTFAGINKTTTATLDGTPALEIFCDTANVLQGSTYPLSFQGWTNGNYTDYYYIYIDWNKDGVFENNPSERYDGGTISNSSGNDGKIKTISITVPLTASLGLTRMRIIKRYNGYSTGPCQTGSGWGQAEDYVVDISAATPCAGTPTAGTTVLTPSTGAPSSAFVATITGGSTGSGLSYQWQIADVLAGPYTDIIGQTSASANLNAVPLPGTTKYYRRKITCSNSGLTSESVGVSFSTTTPGYCTPSSTNPNDLYINSFQFVGSLNDNATANTSGAGVGGYTNFTTLTHVVKQPQGSVLNIVSSAVGSDGKPKSGYWKAWVDYNGDGTFSAAEQVYNLTSLSTESLTFGFVIPANTPVGKYRFRIRIGNDTGFTSCNNASAGETEDYLFEVIADCAAKINTATLKDVQRCGTGTIKLEATGTGTGIRWYAAPTGGVPLFDGLSYTTDIIPENTRKIYYVVAYNGNCESAFRIPVTAIANPGPAVNFGTVPSFCEPTTSGQLITATNGTRLDVLLNETFDSGLGKFEQSNTVSPNLDEPNTYWINRPSPYIPPSKTDTPAGPYEGLAPALSSGYTGGNFAMSNTDFNRRGTLLNRMTLKNNLNTTNFLNLKLDFDLYYFTLITAADPENYFSVDYSVDGGSNWINLPNVLNLSPVPTKPDIYTNQGNPNIWKKISVDLPSSVLNLTTFKIRFSSYSFGKTGSTSFKESIAAIDNVKIYGIKDESSKFGWSSPVNGILYESNCTTPLNSTTASTICIKPDQAQFENNVTFSISASASFSNGCPATGTIVVANDLKVYDIATSNVWNNTANWKPDATVPTADKCVVIKRPVSLISGNGLAKNITIEPGGSLTINKDQTLTVTDYIKNNTTLNNANNLVVESDGNLIQINSGAANIGSMTAKRQVKDLRYQPGTAVDYVYWSSPVAGQKTKGIDGFAPGTPNGNFFYYRESNDRFYETGDPTFTPGRGYAVRAEGNITPTYTKTYEFKGTPNNGDISFPITRSADTGIYVHGYNLVGNPYPSNINFDKLYTANNSLIYNTAWFWTNSVYVPTQQGSTYNGNNYAVYNGTGGTPATLPANVKYSDKIPTGIINVGQAFLVQKKDFVPGSLSFKNTYGAGQQLRVSTGGTFYSRGTESKNRFWLKLQSPDELINSQLIGYIQGATNEFEIDYDAEAFSLSSNLFYSLLGDKKLLIQGKSETFTVEDRVQLGANFFQTGTYTIALDNAEGIFKAGQAIYLKDKQTGNTANLSEGNYTFQAAKGETNGRFEIVYKPEIVLVTDHQSENGLIVYRDSDNFVVQSQTKKITAIEVYELSGKLVYSLTPNSLKKVIPADKLLNNTYVLKINQGGVITTKKIIK